MARPSAAILLLLVVQPAAAYRRKPSKTEKDGSLAALAQIDNEKAQWCSSICIPCADGKRSILVSRERGMDKFLDVVVVAGIAVTGGLVTPWALAALPAYSAFKAYRDGLVNECPNINIVFFDKNESGIYGATPDMTRFPSDRLQSILSKDEYLGNFQKNLDRLYVGEKALAEDRDPNFFEHLMPNIGGRQHNQLPTSLMHYAMYSELFCQDYGEDIGNPTVENFGGMAARAVGWQTFFKSCAETVAMPTERCCCKDTGSIECKLMFEDELKKSWNPLKWNALVCPSEDGYLHYKRFLYTSLPEGCLK